LPENILSIEKVSKHFHLPGKKTKVALQEISFQLKKGEILGIIGESGSGKTTLARIIAGLEKADIGRIVWKDQRKTNPFLVQMVFQNPYAALYRGMTVEEIIAEPLLIQGLSSSREKIENALRQVHLAPEEGYRERYPHQLSGGQRQRVALARALILNPAVLIADEPTSMLDMSVQGEILQLLLQLRQETDLSILLITHDLAVASYLCDQVGVLQSGSLVELGKVENVISSPQNPYTKKLVEIAKMNTILV